MAIVTELVALLNDGSSSTENGATSKTQENKNGTGVQATKVCLVMGKTQSLARAKIKNPKQVVIFARSRNVSDMF